MISSPRSWRAPPFAAAILERNIDWGVVIDNLPEARQNEALRKVRVDIDRLRTIDPLIAVKWLPKAMVAFLYVATDPDGILNKYPRVDSELIHQSIGNMWVAGFAFAALQAD